MNFHNLNIVNAQAGVQPPQIVHLLGKKIRRAWVSPDNHLLVIQFVDNWVITAEPHEDVGDLGVIEFKTAQAQPDKDWDPIDREMPQTRHTKALRGLAFTGLDNDVVAFGKFGARVTRAGIEWVRLP